jgi:uncharacterized Zn-binding protein involved in type VI secretion
MAGLAVQQGATVLCIHSGSAQPVAVNHRVRLDGFAGVSLGAQWKVDCPSSPPPSPPCVTATWTAGSTRVTSMGQPLVIQGGTATCVPTGSPLTVMQVQPRVRLT